MSHLTTKLQSAKKYKVPVVQGAYLFLEALLAGDMEPALPKTRTCAGCDTDVVKDAFRLHQAGTLTGLAWVWHENINVSRKEDAERIIHMIHNHRLVLEELLDVTKICYVVDEASYICPQCMENHVRQVHQIYGVPYDEEPEADASCGAASEPRSGDKTPNCPSPDRDASANSNTDRSEA